MYQVAGNTLSPDDPGLSAALGAVYGTACRPMCMCRPGGIEMYIAKIGGDNYIIKRMPHSGARHSADCEHYEPPAELSGRGEVIDGAIQTDMADGVTTLRLGFSLSKSGTRAAPAKGNTEHDSVESDGKKLTLRGALHFLYDEAGLNRWSPAMEGKRNWWVIRKSLLNAAADKKTKGNALSDLLFVPESFHLDRKDEIAQRRTAAFRTLTSGDGTTRKLMLLVGELKEIGEARFGKKLVIKHLPDCTFLLNEDIYKRFLKRFAVELALWSGNETSHLMVIATFGANPAGIASVEELSVMLVNEQWIPYESVDDLMLLDELIAKRRRFVKGLRYNLPSTKPLAVAVLNDTPEPVALYIRAFGKDDGQETLMQELIDGSDMQSWEWRTSDVIPDFPPAARR